jgi:hypothetical protein
MTHNQLWERILHTTGGKLEIPKCTFALFTWYFDRMGRAILHPSTQQQLHVKCSETSNIMLVPQMEPSKAYKYVGVHIALNGSMKDQITQLKTKCNKINGALSQGYTTAKDTKQGFTTVFIPSISYVLPATSIQEKELQQIQRPIINTVLTKIGYNQHMPRAVVFAPITAGGIGLLDLYTEQERSKINIILSHTRSKSPLHPTIIIPIETYQLSAGITKPALEHTQPHQYITNAPWISSVRSFLHCINAKIHIPELKTPILIREYDKPIMESQNIDRFTKSELESINTCRLYLQVTTLAEIAYDNGLALLHCAVKGTMTPNNTPCLWNYSRSTLDWPYQEQPPQRCWNIWKRFLLLMTTNNMSLILEDPLGDWLNTAHQQRDWHYQLYHSDIIYQTKQTNQYFTRIRENERWNTYVDLGHPVIVPTANQIPMIPIQLGDEAILCNNPMNMIEVPNNLNENLCSEIPINYQQLNNTTITQYDTLLISSDGGLNRTTATFGGIIAVNDTPLWAIKGSLPQQISPTPLTSEAYGCYWVLEKTLQIIPEYMYNINILLLLDNKSLIARIQKLRQQPNQYPTKCMVPEYNIISAIVNIMQPLSNITIQYTKSKTNKYHHFCHLLADEAKTMEIPNTTIIKTTHQMPELIINNQKVSSEYTDEIRRAIAQPALNDYLKTKYLRNDATIEMVDWRSHG